MLQGHPDLCFPEGVKETMFFGRYFERGIEWYSQYFRHAQSDELLGEVAPTYFSNPAVPKRIQRLSPNCTIFITLRNPVERAWSLFLHHLKKGRVSDNFYEAAERIPEIIDGGRYAHHIPRWKSIFGAGQVELLLLRDLDLEPEKTLHSIQRTLGVTCIAPPGNRGESINDRSLPRFPVLARGASFLATKLHEYGLHDVVRVAKKTGAKSFFYSGGEGRMPMWSASTRKALSEKYEEDIRFIEEETGRDLSGWREQPS